MRRLSLLAIVVIAVACSTPVLDRQPTVAPATARPAAIEVPARTSTPSPSATPAPTPVTSATAIGPRDLPDMVVTFSHPLVESSVAQPTEGIRPGETLVIDIVTQPGARVEFSFSLSPNRQPKYEHLADYLSQFGALVSSSPEKYAESVIESFRKDFPDEELPFGGWDNGICIADERGYCQYRWLLGTADYLMDPNPDDDRPGNVEIIIHFSIDNVGRTRSEYIAVLGTPDLSLVDIDLCDIGLCATNPAVVAAPTAKSAAPSSPTAVPTAVPAATARPAPTSTPASSPAPVPGATAQPAPISTPSSALTPTPTPSVTPTAIATVTPIATTTVVPTPVAVSIAGSCETTVQHSEWNVTWHAINYDGTLGDVLATETFQPTFDKNWSRGEVTSGHVDQIRLFGIMDIVVTRRGPVSFTVGGDDGYRLVITGNGLNSKEIINDWDAGSYRVKQVVMNLEPGIYRLNLDYFELTGAARLDFDTNSNVVAWNSVGDCTGDVNVAPEGPYAVLKTDAPLPDVATKFGVEASELLIADYLDAPNWVLVPGPAPPPLARKIIVIQGVDSDANGGKDLIQIQSDSFSSRVGTIVAAIQSGAWDVNSGQIRTGGLVPVIDQQDVITFSYSGFYKDTLTDNVVGIEEHSGTSRYYADYEKADTCTGVAAGALKLDRLIKRLVDPNPDVEIDIVAHSMGGMVAAYLLATSDAEHLANIKSVITLDSPLQGTTLIDLRGVADFFLGGSECIALLKSTQAHYDLLPDSAVVNVIATLEGKTKASKFYSIKSELESTELGVGSSLPGEPLWIVICGGDNPGAAHSCVWSDELALSVISDTINLVDGR